MNCRAARALVDFSFLAGRSPLISRLRWSMLISRLSRRAAGAA